MTARARIVVVVLLLAGAAAYVHLNPPERITLEAGTLNAFPSALDGWRSVDLAFTEVVYEELEADDTLARRYTNEENESVWFVIVFHQNDRYGAHDPLVCYQSQGWTLIDSGLLRLEREAGDFDANWILVEGHDLDGALERLRGFSETALTRLPALFAFEGEEE